MDIVQARKKAREKAEREAKAGRPELPKPAPPETVAAKASARKSKPARAPEKKGKAASKAKGSPAAPPASSSLGARARPASSGMPPPAEKPPASTEEVFQDMSFGEDLPVEALDSAELELGESSRPAPAKPAKPAAPKPAAPPPPPAAPAARPLGARATPPAAKALAAPSPPRDLAMERLSDEKEDLLELVSEDLYRREFGEEWQVEAGEQLELISFRLAQETYAIRLTHVQQIIKLREITLVPRAPEYILGVVSLRGQIIPIVDLRRRLGLAAGGAARETRIIVVMEGAKVIGLIVDQVEQVVRIPAGAIEPPPPVLGGLESDYIEGIGRFDGRMLILLNLSKVLISPLPRDAGH